MGATSRDTTSERGDKPSRHADIFVGLALYSSTAFAWVFVMGRLKLATIGAVYSVCMIMMLTAMGFVFFDERRNPYETARIVFSIASIILLSRFGRSAPCQAAFASPPGLLPDVL
jgi:multidrug transporter EmrE-like cation transporter